MLRLTILILVLTGAWSVHGQEFEENTFTRHQSLIDSFYTAEDYHRLKEALETQIEYLKAVDRPDSLHLYVYKLGRSLSQTHGLDQAVTEVEELIDLIRQTDPDTSHILSSINDLAWIYYEAGKDSLCLATDLRFLHLCDQYAGASPIERSDAHYNLGFDYQTMGNTAKGIHHFEKALIPIDRDDPEFLQQRMNCYNALGAAYWRNGQMSEAKKALTKSNELSFSMSDTIRAKLFQSNALGNLSLIYEDEANLAKSMEILEKSIKLRKEALPYLEETYDRDIHTGHLIRGYRNLSALYLNIGDLDRSIAMNEYVAELQKDFYPPDHPAHGKLEEAKGSLQLAAGNYRSAEKHLLKALESALANYGERSYYVAVANQRLGEIYIAWEKFDEAEKYLNRTIEVALLINDEFSSQELAKTYQLRAEVMKKSGRTLNAHSDYRKSAGIYARTRGPRSIAVGNILLDRAKLFMETGTTDSAGHYLNEVLSIYEEERSENIKSQTGNYRGIVRRLPEAYLLKARMSRSNSSDHEAYLEKAMAYLRSERRNFDSDGSQLSFFEDHSEIYREAAALAYQRYKLTGDHKYKAALLRVSEEHKTVLLKRRLNKFSSLRLARIPDSLVVAEEMLLAKLSDPENKDDYADLEAEYDELLTKIKSEYPSYYELRYDTKAVTIEDIQNKILKAGQTLIEYIDTGNTLIALVITTRNSELVALGANDYSADIASLNDLILQRNQAAAHPVSTRLREILFDPLLPYLDGDEIFIVPDGGLYALNFEALTTETGFLIEDYTFSYFLSSTTALLYGKLKESRLSSGVLAIAPGFENGENLSSLGQRLIRQPFAMKTAIKAGDIFSGKSLVAARATEERFKREADKYRIIHIGTHTEVNVKSPMLSRLILARSEDEDGYLHAYELYNLALRAELAVLTACETGIGKESTSEGMLSMAHGFAYAGCPSLIMSLWEIDEKTSAGIIEDFYENLAGGMAKNRAIRQAKLDYLRHKEGELKNPYYWSGLVLFGDVAPVEKDTGIWWWFLAAGVITLAMILFLRSSKKAA